MSEVLNIDDFVKIMNGGKEPLDAKNHPLFPQHSGGLGSFRLCICGRAGKGKTNLAISMIVQSQIHFDHLYLYARDPTQPKYQFLLKWCNSMEDEIERETGERMSIVTVITDITKAISVDDMDNTIINLALIDDMLLEKDQRLIEEYFVRGRHKHVDCIYLGQKYHMIPNVIRTQCDYFAIFGVSSKEELIQLSKDHSLMHEYNEFKEMMTQATRDTNSFLLIDRRTQEEELMIRKNWNQIWNPITHEFEPLEGYEEEDNMCE